MTAAPEQKQGPQSDIPLPLTEHLKELRSRLLRSLAAIAVVLVALTPFAARLYTLIATPLMSQLPAGSSMIAIEVASPFMAPFKLILVLSVMITAPYLLLQAWKFAAPGLYQNEKRFSAMLFISSIMLFYCGAVFAWFVVLPIVFAFFHAVAPDGVTVMTDIHHYLNFVLKMFVAFGFAFELPVAVILVVRAGLISARKLARGRPYVIIGCFIIGMILTPPDIISQLLLALPMWLLFEIGICISLRIDPSARRPNRAAQSGHSDSSELSKLQPEDRDD